MPDSLKSSAQGLEILNRARIRKGWRRQASVWSQKAFTSVATLKRLWQGEPIQRDTFIRLCQAVGVDWTEVADPTSIQSDFSQSPVAVKDWGEAPDLHLFCGRIPELTQLNQWVTSGHCQMIALLGMGGIGKTALAVQFVEQIHPRFDHFVWRSLRQAPSLATLADLLMAALSSEAFPTIGDPITDLLEHLRHHRCLLVLDHIEAILSSGELTGKFQEGYQDYGKFLHQLAQERHNSCILVIGREQPKEILSLESKVQRLHLHGLSNPEATELLQAKALNGQGDWETLIQLYRGNPLALNLIATTIQTVFDGNVTQFLQYPTLVLGDFSDVLEDALGRLSPLEEKVMQCLAIADNSLSLPQIRTALVSSLSYSDEFAVVESLVWRSLIEKIKPSLEPDNEVLFTLQPTVRKYIKERDPTSICPNQSAPTHQIIEPTAP